MKIIVPQWAAGIEDDGILLFVAFAHRVCELYGFNTEYHMAMSDLAKMTNKPHQGVCEWLRECPQIFDNMEIGNLLDGVAAFEISKPVNGHIGRARKVGSIPKTRIRAKEKDRFTTIELKEERSRLIWIYILGCFNHNLIAPDDYEWPIAKNSVTVSEFLINRAVIGYVKQKDRLQWKRQHGVEDDDETTMA